VPTFIHQHAGAPLFNVIAPTLDQRAAAPCAAALMASTPTQPRGGAANPRLGEDTYGVVPPGPSDGIAPSSREKGFPTMRPGFSDTASAAQLGGISPVIAARRIGQPG
jgi:hypothetical protein